MRESLFVQTKTQMRSLLGAFNVYRRILKDFAKSSSTVNEMFKKNSTVGWNVEVVPTEDQRDSFEKFKKCLSSRLVLALPMSRMLFMIDFNASENAIGFVLLQQ